MTTFEAMTKQPIVDIQIAVEADGWPDEDALGRLVSGAVGAALSRLGISPAASTELSLLFADNEAVCEINAHWRGIRKPTNVLSFPAAEDIDPTHLPPVLGDIVLAFETVSSEAALENKPFDHHLSHLVVHGLLHILGYDHQSDDEAAEMETMETAILAKLAIPDPYGKIEKR